MSEASFCRFIKQHTSKSFIDFLTDIRLGAASRALVDSSLSIAEIGYDCGFNNLSNFNRIFKKKKGVTPKEFRDNYRKNKTIIKRFGRNFLMDLSDFDSTKRKRIFWKFGDVVGFECLEIMFRVFCGTTNGL